VTTAVSGKAGRRGIRLSWDSRVNLGTVSSKTSIVDSASAWVAAPESALPFETEIPMPEHGAAAVKLKRRRLPRLVGGAHSHRIAATRIARCMSARPRKLTGGRHTSTATLAAMANLPITVQRWG
jgi:hypothetical protein